MRLRYPIVVLAATLLSFFGLARDAAAQAADVIRGRVTGPDSLAIENVRVSATSLSGNVTRTTRSDRNGRFTITFPDGDGDYIIAFAGIGYGAKQFEVKRLADEDILVADAQLSRAVQTVDPVEITSRDRVVRNDNPADVSGTDRTISSAGLTPDQLGDLAAAAASIPGVTFLPGEDGDPNGYSVLGLGADQNNTTLNGMDFGGSNLPRDAAVSSSLVTSPYDVSRGGFSGAQTALRTRSGTNIRVRGMSLNVDSPRMQWTDQAAQALGAEYSNLSWGGTMSGPFTLNSAYYNLSAQLGRRSNDLQTMLNTSPVGLEAANIAPDSVDRLLSILQTNLVPLTPGRIADSRVGDQGSVFGALDFTPINSLSGSAYNVSFSGSWGKQTPVSGSASELPAHSGDNTNWSGGIQGRHSGYFGFLLSETSLGLSTMKSDGNPYLALPSGRVRVTSTLSDGSTAVQNLTFGGSPSLNSGNSTTTFSFLNALSWFSGNNQHRLKLTSELRYDATTQDVANNLLGSFAFNSLADLETGTPSSFTRQLTSRQRETKQLVGGVALGDSYRRNADVQFQYGIRVDANRFLSTPLYNPAVDSVYGARNDYIPNRLYVSPRVGFSWTYGDAPTIASFAGAVRGPAAVVRGGIGLFQNTPSTGTVGSALDNTGLASAIQQLNCVGAAAPVPDWPSYLLDPATVPTECTDGTQGTVFNNTSPNVSLFARNYVAPRSVRSNLSWSGSVIDNRFALGADVTYSLNLNQTGAVDLNFNPVPQFTLADEGNRPVYVQPTSIVASTGAIASRDARVSQLYSRVTETRSDLRSRSGQVSLRLSPTITSPAGLRWNLSYVLSDVKEQVRGFTSTVGNPLDVEWAGSSLVSRHQISYGLQYNFFGFVTVGWNGTFRSGMPFTPMVAGDANGDGYQNDRAFVFDPGLTGDLALANGMQALLETGSREARNCLVKQLNALADRNSCMGPWTSSASMSITLDPVKFRMPHRATLNLSLSNPLGAADLLAHGSGGLRGWGQQANLDQSLLYIRGFDQSGQRYLYDVNQRFGSKNASAAGFRTPVTLTALLRFDVGPTREHQSLIQQLDRGRGLPNTTKYNEATFRALYGATSVANPLPTILRSADSLQLTGPQADSLTALTRMYTIRVDSIWAPVAKYLAELPDRYPVGEAFDRYQAAREQTVDLLIQLAPDIRGLLTAEQRRKLPATVINYLDVRFLAAIRPGTGAYIGAPAGAPGGGGGGGAQTITIGGVR